MGIHANYLVGAFPFGWKDGRMVTDEDIYECIAWYLDPWLPLLKQARDQLVGARREWYEMVKNVGALGSSCYAM
jgi:hypothetical protein